MRKIAYLKEPMKCDGGHHIFKVMLYEAEEGFYLFEYWSPDAVQSSADRLYESLEDLQEEWNALIDERGWAVIEDPLPDCQHDAWIPLRVKGRDKGCLEWGRFETLKDGKWVAFPAAEQ